MDFQSRSELESPVASLEVNKKTYATSLIWYAAESKKGYLQELRETLQNTQSPLYCEVRGSWLKTPLYGITDRSLSHKKGQPSMAALFATLVRKKSFLGAFRADDDCWFMVGINDQGMIVYDKAYISEKALHKEFNTALVTSLWQRIICPSAWRVENSEEKSIGSILKKRSGGPKLRQLGRDNRRLILIMSVLLGVAVIGLAVYFAIPLLKPKPKPVVLPPRPVIPKYVTIDTPWAGRPTARSTIETCQEQILRYGALLVPGWTMDTEGLVCEDGFVKLKLHKGQEGTINWILPLLRNYKHNIQVRFYEGKDDFDIGKSISIRWLLPVRSTYAQDSVGTDNLDNALIYLIRQFQEIHQAITLKWGRVYDNVLSDKKFMSQYKPATVSAIRRAVAQKVATSSPRERSGRSPSAAAGIPYRTLHYSFESELPPSAYLNILGALGGQIVQKIVFNPSSSKWYIEGYIYGFGKDDKKLMLR